MLLEFYDLIKATALPRENARKYCKTRRETQVEGYTNEQHRRGL